MRAGVDVDHSVERLGVGLDPADLVQDEHGAGAQACAHVIGMGRVEEEGVDDEFLGCERIVFEPGDQLIELIGVGHTCCGDEFAGCAGGELLIDDHRQPQFASAATMSSTVFLASNILSLSTSSICRVKTR